jgi:hypothetical protein
MSYLWHIRALYESPGADGTVDSKLIERELPLSSLYFIGVSFRMNPEQGSLADHYFLRYS